MIYDSENYAYFYLVDHYSRGACDYFAVSVPGEDFVPFSDWDFVSRKELYRK